MSNYSKLKTNLKLAIQRLKLLEKKKTELSLKSRKEIADFLAINKSDRARIRVEHIIREDNYVEAMEMLEMFCDLLLARFGLIEKMKELDPGLDEAIATLIWAAPRVSTDIAEFKIIAEILSHKYGKQYAEACKADKINNVNEKVKKRLGLEAPAKLLVEQYLIEIAKNFNINYVPDNNVMLAAGQTCEELIQLREYVDDINKKYGGSGNNNNNNSSGGATAPIYSTQEKQIPIGFNELNASSGSDLIDFNGGDINNNEKKVSPSLPNTLPIGHLGINNTNIPPPPSYYPNMDDIVSPNAPPLLPKSALDNENDSTINQFSHSPPPTYNMKFCDEKPIKNVSEKKTFEDDDNFDLNLPSVPDSHPDSFAPVNNINNNASNNNVGSASIDYDELTKRFQNLKQFK